MLMIESNQTKTPSIWRKLCCLLHTTHMLMYVIIEETCKQLLNRYHILYRYIVILKCNIANETILCSLIGCLTFNLYLFSYFARYSI